MPRINTQIPSNKLLISIPEASARLSVAASTGRDWLSKGIFPVPTVKVNGMRLVPVKLLEQYVDNLIEVAVSGAYSKPIHKATNSIDNLNLNK